MTKSTVHPQYATHEQRKFYMLMLHERAFKLAPRIAEHLEHPEVLGPYATNKGVVAITDCDTSTRLAWRSLDPDAKPYFEVSLTNRGVWTGYPLAWRLVEPTEVVLQQADADVLVDIEAIERSNELLADIGRALVVGPEPVTLDGALPSSPDHEQWLWSTTLSAQPRRQKWTPPVEDVACFGIARLSCV